MHYGTIGEISIQSNETKIGESMKIILVLAMLFSMGGLQVAHAQDDKLSAMKEALATRLPDIKVTSLSESPVPGVYELISDGQIYYVGEGARYIFDGDLIDMESRTNLTDARKGGVHMAMINQIDESEMLIYEPKEKSDRSVTVFTDISCGYCRKLHAEMEELLEGGVRVRYLLFPRAGIGSPAHQDLESVWCAEDPQDAMTNAKSGGKIVKENCANPIEAHVAIAEQVGLRGTPLIYLDSGEMVPGYRAASQLVQMINNSEPL